MNLYSTLRTVQPAGQAETNPSRFLREILSTESTLFCRAARLRVRIVRTAYCPLVH